VLLLSLSNWPNLIFFLLCYHFSKICLHVLVLLKFLCTIMDKYDWYFNEISVTFITCLSTCNSTYIHTYIHT
jgi:hypothetical protein